MEKMCEKCRRLMKDTQFYTYKDGRKSEFCKRCLTMHINNFEENTFIWLLEKFDVPYIPAEWNVLRDRALARVKGDPTKLTGLSVFGKYLSKMKLNQWKDYTYADSARIQILEKERSAQTAQEIAEIDAEYQEKFESGEISESEYRTMTSALQQRNAFQSQLANEHYIGEDNFYDESQFIDESELPDPAAQLTKEDKIYLAMKWGTLYKPSEWISLETDYKQMTESFGIEDADSKNTLILLCKTNLKANQAIDQGDIEGYQKLAKVSESLRKTAKFTAAQNKEKEKDYVDSIGQLITLCEQQGFIPRYCTDIPQDKVDLTLRDMNEYVKKLVTQDLGFGAQIESSLKKIMLQNQMNEEAEQEEEEEEDGINTTFNPFDMEQPELQDSDFEDFYEFLEDAKKEEEID